jgi:hypothetical protein
MSHDQGIRGKNVRHVTAPKVEPRAHARNPAAVGQYGQLQGSHVTRGRESNYRGEPDTMRRGYRNPIGPTSMALSGPGAGREVLRSGGQGTHGAVNAGNPRSSPDRHIISSYGPDYRRPGNPNRSDSDADF